MEIVLIVLTIGISTIVIGVLGQYLFIKTGIPDMIFLMSLGLMLGLSQIIDTSYLMLVAPLFGALALIMILFDGGVSMDVRMVIRQSPRALLLASLGFFFSVCVIYLVATYALGLDFLSSIFLGSVLGGSSSLIVIPLIKKLAIDERVFTVLSLESVFSDVFCTIFALATIQMLRPGYMGYSGMSSLSGAILKQFIVGMAIGFIIGFLWLYLYLKKKGFQYQYALLLAFLFAAYTITEECGGNGPLSALTFGLVLGNSESIVKGASIDSSLKSFHSEVSFLVRTFFFVYIGAFVKITSIPLIVYGIAMSALLLVARHLAVTITVVKSSLNNRALMSMMLPRGLAAAVLSQYGVIYKIPNAYLYTDVTFFVIIATTLMCTYGVYKAKQASAEKVAP